MHTGVPRLYFASQQLPRVTTTTDTDHRWSSPRVTDAYAERLTELIRAGVDVRTVAGRLGHADGGTTLAYYAAWVREADQRASRILMRQLPMPRPPTATAPGSNPTFRRPVHPYQVIAAQLRAAILAGALPTGTILPTVTQLGARHHVAPSTIHRAIALLAAEHLVTVSRGHRAVVSPVPAEVADA